MKRQRVERGILGVKKDPKNQILFSFQARDGEEWPSDSDDSDYLPSDVEDEVKNKKKKSFSKKSTEKARVKRKITDSGDNINPSTSHTSRATTCSRLPAEIWSKILMEVIKSQGPLPFLCRAARVCRLWRDIVSEPQFWRHIDLSYGWIRSKDSTLRWLVRNRLSLCESLNLKSWGTLSDDILQTIGDGCPRLTTVNLSFCKKLGVQGMSSLVDSCENLRDVDISFSNISTPVVKHLVTKRGTNLRQLNISGNNFNGTVLDIIVAGCPNLEHLDISNSLFSSEFIAVEVLAFQKGCPRVRVLNLGNSKFREKIVREGEELPGFKELEELSFGCLKTVNSMQIKTEFVEKILFDSPKLRLLDLRGCESIDLRSITLFNSCTGVEELYLANSGIKNYGDKIADYLQQWQHSLRVIDLSKNQFRFGADAIDTSFQSVLSRQGQPPFVLEQINLEATNVSVKTIRLLIEKCPRLHTLNLSSCYGLPRGVKKEHTGKSIRKLLKLLESE